MPQEAFCILFIILVIATINASQSDEYICSEHHTNCNDIRIRFNSSNTATIICPSFTCINTAILCSTTNCSVVCLNNSCSPMEIWASHTNTVRLHLNENAFEHAMLDASNAKNVIIKRTRYNYTSDYTPIDSYPRFYLPSVHVGKVAVYCYGFGCVFMGSLLFDDIVSIQYISITINGCGVCTNINQCVNEWKNWFFYCEYSICRYINYKQTATFINDPQDINCNIYNIDDDDEDEEPASVPQWVIWCIVICVICLCIVSVTGMHQEHQEQKEREEQRREDIRQKVQKERDILRQQVLEMKQVQQTYRKFEEQAQEEKRSTAQEIQRSEQYVLQYFDSVFHDDIFNNYSKPPLTGYSLMSMRARAYAGERIKLYSKSTLGLLSQYIELHREAEEKYVVDDELIDDTDTVQFEVTSSEYKVQQNFISKCDLKECDSLKTIKNISITSQNNEENIYDAIDEYGYVKLLNHFNHLMMDHGSEFESIYNILSQNNSCVLSECAMMRRNIHRRTQQEIVNEQQLNARRSVIQQLSDRIHSYYMHSFDTGLKLTEADKEQIATNAVTNEDKDAILYTTQQCIQKKKHSIEKPMRFVTNDVNEYKNGERFYYWNYYKDKSRTTDPAYAQSKQMNIWDYTGLETGHELSYFYIPQKYGNFKDELLNNHICTITSTVWDQSVLSAETHFDSELAREISECPRRESAVCYDMRFGQKMQVHHVLSVMMYCNKDTLARKFSETFRYIDSNETVDELKARHSNYYHFGKYLREAVECYGMKWNDDSIQAFHLYHGVSIRCTLSSMNTYIKGPFSTTTEYSVAVNFCQNEGIVLDINMNLLEWVMETSFNVQFNQDQTTKKPAMRRLNCWNCCWLSDFANEQEILFIGGIAKLSVTTIIEVSGITYLKYIRGIKQITYSMSNGDIFLSTPMPRSREETQIVFRLLSHELSIHDPKHKYAHKWKECPQYIKTILHKHCMNIKMIAFLNRKHESKVHEKFFNYNDGWIKLDVITTIFSNVTEIVFAADKKPVSFIKKYTHFERMLVFMKENPQTKLEAITIIVSEEQINEMKDIIANYKHKFRAYFWKIGGSHIGGDKGTRRITISNFKIFWTKLAISNKWCGRDQMPKLLMEDNRDIEMFG